VLRPIDRNSISGTSAMRERYLTFLMKTLKLPQNPILVIYLGLLLLGLTFGLTGYSFSFDPLNILLIIIVISYPILKFIRSAINSWLKIVIGLFLVISLILIFWNIPIMLAFGRESTLSTIQRWNFSNYKISLTKKQGWAGGPYLQYDLIRYRFFRLVNKTIAVGYPEQNQENSCRIRLKEDYYSDISLFEFDTCRLKLEKMPSNGR
jgi:hypothetical protein